MFRKFSLGAAALGLVTTPSLFASELQFSKPMDGLGSANDTRSVLPASWDGIETSQAQEVSVSPEVTQASWGKFKPCTIGCDNGSSVGCDTYGCDSPSGASGLVGLGLFPNLSGLIKRSEHCYDDFISPITNPVYFEDPRQLTEARGIFINHRIPGGLGGNGVQLYAVQIRVRLTERLSLIAVKDGFIVSQSNLLQDGWADLTAGLKYSLYRNAAAGQLLSVGARFESPVGSTRTLQGNGDGVLDIFLSGGTRIGASGHYLTSSGFILPMDSRAENQMFYWSHHLDKRIANSKFYALTELNWFNYMNNASAFPAVEGGDLFNLGASGVGGNNLVSNAYGLRYKPNGNLETGVAYEFPLSEVKGLLENRLNVDLILRF